MRTHHSGDHTYKTYSLNFNPNNNNNHNEHDTASCNDLNETYRNPNIMPNLRQTLNENLTNTVLNHNMTKDNGLIINGSLFDRQLFQSPRSSYILDYSETPHDLNQFTQGHNMTSQLDKNLFKLSFIITLSEYHIDKELLLDYCPNEDNGASIIEEISFYKAFCFPELYSKDKFRENLLHDSATYVFTRTNSKGEFEYGYCRRMTLNHQTTRFPIVICLVSAHSYFKLYDAILNELTTVYMSNELECSLLMQSFYSKPLPKPTPNSSGIVCILNDHRVFFYVCPHDDRLNHDYFATLLSCLSPSNFIYLFESMLRSKRILCFSNSLSKLTKCCLALSHLLYPFTWPYPFVSLMPSSWLYDLLDSPCPYLYGCLHENIKDLSSPIDKDSLRVDLDSNTIDTSPDDSFFLPYNLRQTLQESLEYLIRFRLIKLNVALINVAVSEACLHVFTELFHILPSYFKRKQIPKKSNEQKYSIYGNHFYFQSNDDRENDLQTVVTNNIQQGTMTDNCKHENRLGYDFQSDEFLISQPISSYVAFLNDFIHGMIFLKFLDDYQRTDNNFEQSFSLFSQRLNERRRITTVELSIDPVTRFRQTFDLLEKEITRSSKSIHSLASKIVKKLFH